MVRHVVMWKLKDYAGEATKDENRRKAKRLLLGLQDKIPDIKAMEVGLNFNPTEDAHDLVLYAEFTDEAALERYQNHPEHRKVASFLRGIRTEKRVVDYWMKTTDGNHF